MEVIQSVKVNPKETFKCLCIKDKPDVCVFDDVKPHDFVKGEEYDYASYEGINGELQYTVIYKTKDYEERVEGTKFFPIKGSRSSHFLNQEDFEKYFR